LLEGKYVQSEKSCEPENLRLEQNHWLLAFLTVVWK